MRDGVLIFESVDVGLSRWSGEGSAGPHLNANDRDALKQGLIFRIVIRFVKNRAGKDAFVYPSAIIQTI
jgi:hypothetical protein